MMGVFFRELHTLTRAGIAIAPACREVERRTPARLRVVAAEMAAATEAGSRISSVLENHPALIYPWHLGVIRAAEVGAFMPEAFDQIARAYETEWETRAALRLRMFFYLLVGLPAILTTLPVVLFLRQPIPDFDAWNTQYVIRGLLHQAETVSLPILAGVIALIVIWQLLGRWAWFQGAQQRVVVRLPLVGKVARGSALERYMGTLGLMLRGGVPIAQAAEEAALAAGNADMSPKLLDFVPRLREGATLSSLLAQSRLLDADSLSMAATGEIAGALPDMLARAAGYYRADLEARRRALLRLAGVAIGLLWAVCVGVVFITGALSYFDFIFRAGDKLWMESFE
jgi:type II secretory pathway component PulF